jgi:hypothetical protein
MRCWASSRLIQIAASIAVIAFAGCGGGGSGAGDITGPKTVGRGQFVTQAKQICDRANEERQKGMEAFLERRARETGEQIGLAGEVEAIPAVMVPTLRKEIRQLEAIGLPRGEAYEAEAIWQTLRIVLHEVEVEGIYAWRSAKILRPFKNRAHGFGLSLCVLN